MSGASMAACMATQVVGSDVTPSPTPNWANCSGVLVASTNTVQIQAINAPITLMASWTGAGGLSAFVNGVQTVLTNPGSFVAHLNDEVSFQAFNVGASGTVTVVNTSDSGATLDTFTYAIYSYQFSNPLPS